MSETIRPLEEEDYARVAEWIMDPKINRWLYAEWRNRKIDGKLIAITSRAGKNYMWLALIDGQPYGLITVGNISRIDRSGIAWYLRSPEVKRHPGGMTDCVRQAMKAAFDELDLHSISASTQAGNLASESLLKKVGFNSVGTLREAFIVEGEYVDRNLFDLLPDDLALEI